MASAFGYEVRSHVPLLRARKSPGPRGTITVRQGPPEILDEPGDVIALDVSEAENGELITFAIARTGSRYLFACSITGGYRLDPEALEVVAAPKGPFDAWEHRLLAVAVPVMLAQRDDLGLHAAAVGTGETAVLFCGPAGRGKSTLARGYAELGYPVLTEDGAIIAGHDGRLMVWPGAAGARIRVPGATGPITKEVVELPGPEPEPLPPGAVVLLDPRGGDGTARPLSRAEALVRISAHLIHAGGESAAAVSFGRLAALLSEVPAYAVSLPDDIERLPAAAERLAGQLVANSTSGG